MKQVHFWCSIVLLFVVTGCYAGEVIVVETREPVATHAVVLPTRELEGSVTAVPVAATQTLPATAPPTPTVESLITQEVQTPRSQATEEESAPASGEFLPGEYVSIQELGLDLKLRYVAWEEDGKALIYAVQDYNSSERWKWSWWRYDIASGEKLSIAPPQSRVSDNARQQLNLCPADRGVWNEICPGYSKLLESPTSNYIVFTPLTTGDGDTWLASIDGSNPQKLDEVVASASYADWSQDDTWLVVGVHFPGMPGQYTHYLISTDATDGASVSGLQSLTGVDNFFVSGLFPEFSPDGNQLAFVGSQVYESFNEQDYVLHVLELETLESRVVSDKFGMFQWDKGGTGIYIFDHAVLPILPVEESRGLFNVREATLYFVDVSDDTPVERLLVSEVPFYPTTDTGSWLWSYSPEANAIAYVGYDGESDLGILFLKPVNANGE